MDDLRQQSLTQEKNSDLQETNAKLDSQVNELE